MADGWRNRYMAPFYALAISFVLALLLGFTLDAPAEPKRQSRPEPVASSIRFASEKDAFPVESAIVWFGGKPHPVASLPELEGLRPTEPVVVCALLQKGFVPVGGEQIGDPRHVCWGPLDAARPGGEITIRIEVER